MQETNVKHRCQVYGPSFQSLVKVSMNITTILYKHFQADIFPTSADVSRVYVAVRFSDTLKIAIDLSRQNIFAI